MKRMDWFADASKDDAHRLPVHFVIEGRRTSATQTTSMFTGARRFPLTFRAPTSANNKVAGFVRCAHYAQHGSLCASRVGNF